MTAAPLLARGGGSRWRLVKAPLVPRLASLGASYRIGILPRLQPNRRDYGKKLRMLQRWMWLHGLREAQGFRFAQEIEKHPPAKGAPAHQS